MPEEIKEPRYWVLDDYPYYLRGIVEVLLKYEEKISDGFEFYSRKDDGYTFGTIKNLAQEIYESV